VPFAAAAFVSHSSPVARMFGIDVKNLVSSLFAILLALPLSLVGCTKTHISGTVVW